MRRVAKWALVAAVLIGAAAALRFTVFRAEPVPVTVFVAARGRVEDTVANSRAGSIKARKRASLSPQIGGAVADLPAREGERVEAGAVLIRLDDGEQRARLALTERSLESAIEGERQACLEAGLARRELVRMQGLYDQKIATEAMLDQATSRRDVTEVACTAAGSRVSEARAHRDLSRTLLSRTIIRAPFDGVVAEVSTELGEWITPSPPGVPIPPVIDLIDLDTIYISAPMDEVDRARVRVDLPVRVTLDSYPDRPLPGRLTRIAPYVIEVQNESRTFEVEAVLDDAGFARGLPPGASADIEVILDVREDVLRVPSYALLEGRTALVLENGHLVAREVETGLKNWEFAEVLSGLEEGDRVVVSLDRMEVEAGARAEQVAVAER